MNSIIYTPKGKALEYAPLAVNLYTGCSHGCLYCFGPGTLRKSKAEFHSIVEPKKYALQRLERDAKKLAKAGDDREILLSFVTDPYQPVEKELEITRGAIRLLKFYDLRFTVLTKGGLLAMRDFDLMKDYNKCSFGTTLTFYSMLKSREWEPSANCPADRLTAIIRAHIVGIKTWVSLEPVIDPKQALTFIRCFFNSVDHWKIGKINRWPEIEKRVDWRKFRKDAEALLKEVGADYYFKESLNL